MGTNYYLHRHPEPCPTCGRTDTDELHIGKSSFGWVFLWHGYRDEQPDGPAEPLTTPDEWATYLKSAVAGGAVIRDEYGADIELDNLLGLVDAKSKRRDNGKLPLRHKPYSPGDTVSVGGSDVLFAEFC